VFSKDMAVSRPTQAKTGLEWATRLLAEQLAQMPVKFSPEGPHEL
jgi:hypothetical protein